MKTPEFDSRRNASDSAAAVPIQERGVHAASIPDTSNGREWFDTARKSPPRSDLKVALQSKISTPASHSASGLALRRFRPPLSAHIEFRNQRPALIRSGPIHVPVLEARGPFLSSGDWWDRHPWSREEWDVQSGDGVMYRIFRSPEGCFLEGVYD